MAMMTTGQSTRLSLPYLDDSGAITPTSEQLQECDFHISEYLQAIQRLAQGSQAELPSVEVHRRELEEAAALDRATSNANLAPWRLTALSRGSLSIDEDFENGNLFIRPPHQRRLERRPAVDDAASILAIDVFSATPRRYRRIAIPMVDDSSSRLDCISSSRVTITSHQGPFFETVLPEREIERTHHDVRITIDDDYSSTSIDSDMPLEPACVRSMLGWQV